VISSAPNQATSTSSTTTAPADTTGRKPHGTEGPRRQAPAGHATTPAQPTAAQTICGTGKLVPACSGFAATSMPPTAPAIKISRPAALAGRSASPVTKTQAPTTTNVSDITHRSAAPTAASALTGSATASTGRGCSPAAMLHPATISTGATADGTTPHHGTPRTIHHRSWCYRPPGKVRRARIRRSAASTGAGISTAKRHRPADQRECSKGYRRLKHAAHLGRADTFRVRVSGRPSTSACPLRKPSSCAVKCGTNDQLRRAERQRCPAVPAAMLGSEGS
jgi:hypothetical protein